MIRTDLTIQTMENDKPRFLGADEFRWLPDEDRRPLTSAMRCLDANPSIALLHVALDEDEVVIIARAEKAYINVYRAQQAYGGPEEGGWWYDTEVREESIDVTHLSHNERLTMLELKRGEYAHETKERDYTSVNANGIHRVRLEPTQGDEYWPKTRPHYE